MGSWGVVMSNRTARQMTELAEQVLASVELNDGEQEEFDGVGFTNSDLQIQTLAEISLEVSYGYTASAQTAPIGPRFLRITDIQNGVVDWSSVPYCTIDSHRLPNE